MSFCSFSENYSMYDVTPIENLFIQEFMTHAPGDYVRVYLYTLMQCYHPAEEMDMSRIARALDMDEEAVLSAFRYWEREGAVTRMSDKPPVYQFVNLKAAMLSGPKLDSDIYKFRDFNNSLQALFGSDRLLHPHEYQKTCEWIEDLKLAPEVVLLMVKAHIERRGRRFNFKSLDKTAIQWAEAGIKTAKDAEDMLVRESRHYQAAQQVLRQFNLRRAPTRDELDLAQKWLEQWQLTPEAILNACRETVKARNPSFGYLDSILASNLEARSGSEMDAQLARQRELRDQLKALLRALGAPQLTPTPDQLTAYQRYLEAGFDAEGIMLIAERIASRGRHSMEDLDRSLTRCVEMKIYKKQEIEKYLADQKAARAQAAQVLAACGQERAPSAGDVAMLNDWLGFSTIDLVLYAAQCALGTQLPMRYADKLLKNWRDAGIRDVAAASRDHASRANQTATQPATPPALLYEQREYKEGDLDYLFVDFSPKEENRP